MAFFCVNFLAIALINDKKRCIMKPIDKNLS